MGIKDVNQIIGKCARWVPLSNYANKTVGIDGRNWMYRFLRSPAYNYHDHPILKGFTNQLNLLKRHGIKPVYVFDDGEAPEAKQDTLAKRRAQRVNTQMKIEFLTQHIMIKRNYSTFEQNELCLTLYPYEDHETLVEELKLEDLSQEEMEEKLEKMSVQTRYPKESDLKLCEKLFSYANVPCIRAQGEADPVLAALSLNKQIDCVLSADMDMLCYGTPILLADLKSNKEHGAVLKEYKLDNVLQFLNWDLERFVEFCILCGCDYVDRIKWLGCKGAKNFIDTHFTIENVVAAIRRKKKTKMVIEDGYMDKVGRARNHFYSASEYCKVLLEDPSVLSVQKPSEEDLEAKALFFETYELQELYEPVIIDEPEQPAEEPKPDKTSKKGKKKLDENQTLITQFF